ncbi:MAG TPA: chaperone modulator CbpM [Roseateles sp.]
MSSEAMVPEVLDDRMELTLVEFCRASRTEVEQIQVWVLEGVLKPHGESPADWRFTASALRRARIARTLAQDLHLNPPGVAMALDLMDEIEALRSTLRRAGLKG